MKTREIVSTGVLLSVLSLCAAPAAAQEEGLRAERVFNTDSGKAVGARAKVAPDQEQPQASISNVPMPGYVSYSEAGTACRAMTGSGVGVASAVPWIDVPFSTVSAGQIFVNITGYAQFNSSNWFSASQGRTGVFLDCTLVNITDGTQQPCTTQGFNLLWQTGRGAGNTWANNQGGTSFFFHWGTRGSIAVQASEEVTGGKSYALRLRTYRLVDTSTAGTLPADAAICNAKVTILHP